MVKKRSLKFPLETKSLTVARRLEYRVFNDWLIMKCIKYILQSFQIREHLKQPFRKVQTKLYFQTYSIRIFCIKPPSRRPFLNRAKNFHRHSKPRSSKFLFLLGRRVLVDPTSSKDIAYQIAIF